MKIKTFEFNPLGVNTYLLSDETNECVVIDAACFYADEKALLLNYIIDHDYVVKHLINTHLHFDHIFGVNTLASQFGLSLECNKADEFLLDNISDQLKLFGIPSANSDYRPEIGKWLNEGDVISFGNQSLRIYHAPGHSPGSLLFYNEESGSVFTGDVLFRGSIGRTDLAGGNFDELVESIHTKLFVMPNETKVYPGHGPITTIDYEKKNNPFVGVLS
ncbi:MAG: MBL fold metallo-hydrolase [Fermentimonas sp.]|jgi:glyoxylase-like metal-dependent hydrolase (beta-lactamase superfamily II)|nr:MBL fold metallo-hydrolase [Fermentimonas sp.]HBT86274.1 MBL fold hydrolase [Porphyromonadaceae bacterium]MDD2931277.1 MBL fold metallo-hydrolase [Fermentimonas sp.]MDD3511200.1 MBL fold metallo-hydrolase [Fermentimonas sp.]MDD4283697.1 MBL fold metallo-hydrolase [Fermentimonas sp.]